jgi:multicomponent Na+:H+ antiporter subunit G
MSLDSVLDVLAGALVVAGALLALAAALGVMRFPDVMTRMHAATKPQVLGLLLVLAGASIRLRTSVDVWMLVLTGAFQLVTAPVAAHLIGRLAYRTRHVRRDLLVVDELEDSGPRR